MNDLIDRQAAVEIMRAKANMLCAKTSTSTATITSSPTPRNDYRRYNEVKVFISQPMNGKDEQTILEERAEMVSRIKEQYPDAEILESYFEDYKPSTGNVALKYLSKSLELLADADEAWFAPGWQNARGCKIENDCAIAYGITVHEIY